MPRVPRPEPVLPADDPKEPKLAALIGDFTTNYARPAFLYLISPPLPDRYNREAHDYCMVMRYRNDAGRYWTITAANSVGDLVESRHETVRDPEGAPNFTAQNALERLGYIVLGNEDAAQMRATIQTRREAERNL
jgi:hypothetical protein